MGTIIVNKQNDMNNKWTDDYGKMRWIGKDTKRKLIAITIHQYTAIKRLETEHKGDNWRSNITMNNKQLRSEWYS